MKSGITAWRSPSNIALVKYWGKKGFQLPGNPSVSMTLTHSYTETTIEYSQKADSEKPSFNFLFHGEKNITFEKRTGIFLEIALKELPALKHFHLDIESSNSFPHSAGIASSASSISSLALCLCQINQQVSGIIEDEEIFYRKASRLARMGSGSASRSVYGGWVLWGETPVISNSSNDYAFPISDYANKVFNTYYDAILIVNSVVKQVTSSEGHKLMESNPFREIKFLSGRQNVIELIDAIKNGNEKVFRNIAEYEAMSLHAMFLTSNPYFVLLKPETLQIIDRLNKFRNESGLEFCFTLDAGPNIHLLYSESIRKRMIAFIRSDLIFFCEKGMWIDDRIGKGPELIQN